MKYPPRKARKRPSGYLEDGFDRSPGDPLAQYRRQLVTRKEFRRNYGLYTGWGPWFQTVAYDSENLLAEASEKSPLIRGEWKRIPGTSSVFRHATDYRRRITRCRSVDPCKWETTPDMLFGAQGAFEYDWWSSDLTGGGELWKRFYSDAALSTLHFEQNQVARAEVQALLKLGNQKANIGESLATARQTANMLAHRSRQLFLALRALKRGNFRSAYRIVRNATGNGISRDLSGLWLEFQYGWKPLMMDIHGLYEHFVELTRPALLLRGASSVRDSVKAPFEKEVPGIQRRWIVTQSVKRDIQCVLHARMSNELLHNLNKLALTNPASLAWELVPLSFVIDWALPLGNCLEAMTATVGLDFVSGSLTNTTRLSATAVGTEYPGATLIAPGLATMEDMLTQRLAYQAFPLPRVYAKNPFSTSHALSALALLRQLGR